MTDSPYNFKTTDWKDKLVNICDSKIQVCSFAISAKKLISLKISFQVLHLQNLWDKSKKDALE